MSFQAHKDEILKFYESTNSFVHEHQQLYGKLVTRLNQKKSAPQSLNGNLDDFMAHSFKEFNQYRTKIPWVRLAFYRLYSTWRESHKKPTQKKKNGWKRVA